MVEIKYFARAFKFCKKCHEYERKKLEEKDYTTARTVLEGNRDFANAEAMQAMEKIIENTADETSSEEFKEVQAKCVVCDYKEPRIANLIAEKLDKNFDELKKMFTGGEGYV